MNMTKIISIVNQKGGTGKSACTANYGVGLAQMKKKVLILFVPISDWQVLMFNL